MNMIQDIESSYRELIDIAAERDLDFFIANSSINHALYVISKFIQKAQENLYVYCHNLNSNIFLNEDIINEMKKNQKLKTKILLREIDRDLINSIKSKLGNSIEIRQINDSNPNSNYFIVSDAKRIRIEYGNQFNLQDDTKARVNFNTPKIAQFFNDFFTTHWSTSTEIV